MQLTIALNRWGVFRLSDTNFSNKKHCLIYSGGATLVFGFCFFLYHVRKTPIPILPISFSSWCYCEQSGFGGTKYKDIFTARKRSLGQCNIFTSICHSVHGGGGLPHRDPLNRDAPGQRPPQTETIPRTVKSGRYASYWNAFLLSLFLVHAVTSFAESFISFHSVITSIFHI